MLISEYYMLVRKSIYFFVINVFVFLSRVFFLMHYKRYFLTSFLSGTWFYSQISIDSLAQVVLENTFLCAIYSFMTNQKLSLYGYMFDFRSSFFRCVFYWLSQLAFCKNHLHDWLYFHPCFFWFYFYAINLFFFWKC